MSYGIVRLLESDGTWGEFEKDWKSQCERYGEDFSEYASGTFSVVRDLASNESDNAGVFAVVNKGKHLSFCQVNTALIPGYDSPVLRARHMTHCPDLDYGDQPIEDYAEALKFAFLGIMRVSERQDKFCAKYIKLHLRSPVDRQFFSMLGEGLNEVDAFESVQARGSWLYVTKA